MQVEQSKRKNNCFEVQAPSSTSPPSPREEFSLSTKNLSTKEPPQRNYNSLYKGGVHNSNSQSSTQKDNIKPMRFTSSW